MNKKNLTQNGLTLSHSAYIILSIAMIAVSAYLMSHFYDTFFPTGFGGSESLCSGDGFWGCDKATTSIAGKIFNVPTAFFGIIIGFFGIFGAIFSSEKMEQTNKFFIYLNALGCLTLFIFSLVVLKGLCPFCTIYYVLSFLAAFLFYKFSDAPFMPDFKIFGIFAILLIVPSIFISMNFTKRMNTLNSLSKQYVDQYKALANQGVPTYESPYKLHESVKPFDKAQIRISVFSDFQCPFCEKVATQMPEVLKGFEKHTNIQYFFYPLDNSCNPKITRSFHAYACKASYLAACDPVQFVKIHDYIFENQSNLSNENLKKWETQFGLKDCFESESIQEEVQKSMKVGEQFKLKSTPTIIINGRKIEGSIPTVHLRAILKSLIKE